MKILHFEVEQPFGPCVRRRTDSTYARNGAIECAVLNKQTRIAPRDYWDAVRCEATAFQVSPSRTNVSVNTILLASGCPTKSPSCADAPVTTAASPYRYAFMPESCSLRSFSAPDLRTRKTSALSLRWPVSSVST